MFIPLLLFRSLNVFCSLNLHVFWVSLQVLVAAVQTLIETVYSVSAQALPIISSFFNLLMPNQAEWTRIRQALPPQVRSFRHRGGVISEFDGTEIPKQRFFFKMF